MFKQIRLYLALILLLTAAISAVRAFGESQPLPSDSLLAAMFTNPNESSCEKPCLFGVRPGNMKLQEAARIVKSHPLVQIKDNNPINSSGNTFQAQTTKGYTIDIGVSDIYSEEVASGAVWDTQMSLPVLPTMGEIVAAWGSPTYIKFNSEARPIGFDLIYRNAGIVLGTVYDPDITIGVNYRPVFIEILDFNENPYYSNCVSQTCFQWQGFKKMGAYTNWFPVPTDWP